MMHAKALLFDSDELASQILHVPTPREAKALGRLVEGYDDVIWRHNSLFIVADGCELKFRQAQYCREVLMETGDKKLAEAAPR